MIRSEFLAFLESQQTDIYKDEPMKLHTTFKIGGNADCLCEVKSVESLKNILARCKEENIPYFILGLGSNLLVSDNGVKGLVIKLGGEFNEVRLESENTIYSGAGATLTSLCSFAKKQSLGGLEFAWGIPGSVGGAVYMDAGAYNGEMKDVVTSVVYMDTDGSVKTYQKNELDFSYRHSVFSDSKKVILGAYFELTPKNQDEIAARMKELMERRHDKQPINFPSAGSVFKRPEGYFAAALIDECGLKGCTVGGAMVSEKHSGFIINKGGATAHDVQKLVQHIQAVVKKEKNVELCCEIKFVE